MSKINIFGASGHAKVIIAILNGNNIVVDKLFDDRAPYKLLDYKVEKFTTDVVEKSSFIIAIGDNNTRKNIAEGLLQNMFFEKAIHKTAIIDATVVIDGGTVVMANSVINSSAVIGTHCIINTAAVIEHDCKIADYVHVSPRAVLCGNVVVGANSHIGAGAIVLPNIAIGTNAIIGAGAVVIKDVPSGVTVVGNPARIIKRKSDEN